MKTLYIIRHALAVSNSIEDLIVEKTLSSYGIFSNNDTIKFLKEKQIVFDVIISSHKARAVLTAKMIGEGLGMDKNQIVSDPKLYDKGYPLMLDLVCKMNDSVNSIALVGHEPEISIFLMKYTQFDIGYLDNSAIVGFDIDTEKWADLVKAKKKLLFHFIPKFH